MPNFSTSSVSELRRMLVESGKYTQEQADNIKGKQNLVDAVLAIDENVETDVETLQFEVPDSEIPLESIKSTAEENEDKLIPTQLDPEWNDYVMSQFAEEELVDGKYPKLSGLRRITQKLIGDIIYSGPSNLYPATESNLPGRASVIYVVDINGYNGIRYKFTAVGGAWTGNTDPEYAVYPECMAENRGEARALRRALQLSVVAAEEITKQDTKEIVRNSLLPVVTDGEWTESDKISAAQLIFLKKKAKDLGIDITKFITLHGEGVELENMTRGTGKKMVELLSNYHSVEIPEEIKSV